MKVEELELYERLFFSALRIRLVEERIASIYPSDEIKSPVHLSIGQEHIAAATSMALSDSDLVFASYRGHAAYLAKGGSLAKMLAELLGRSNGFAKGKAGSMHMADMDAGVMGSSAIVGSTLTHAVGAAYGLKLKRSKGLVVSYFGEGSTGSGTYHEALNLAAVYRVPIIFLCENNNYAIFSKFNNLHAYSITKHAAAYGIDSARLDDGQDLIGIYNKISDVVASIRQNPKPYLIEISTCRYRQHVGPNDDGGLNYRSKTEVSEWMSRDPLISDRERVSRYSPKIIEEIENALEFARNGEFPGFDELVKDVF